LFFFPPPFLDLPVNMLPGEEWARMVGQLSVGTILACCPHGGYVVSWLSHSIECDCLGLWGIQAAIIQKQWRDE
jgi:hypothetical protein